ncbi:MAG: CTP synthase, partial [Candidatus Omnitrophota bacterium]
LKLLNLKRKDKDLVNWKKDVVNNILNPRHQVKIAIVGKYIQLQDAYKSIYESLTHAGIANKAKIELLKIDAETLEKQDPAKVLKDMDGILVPGGFGYRGVEGKINAIKYARENKIPLLGLCLGVQCVVIEFARNVLGFKDANSTEFNKKTRHPVISLLEEQKKIKDLGGTMRLGSYPCRIKPSTKTYAAYKKSIISERHRHRYEFNNKYRNIFQKYGLNFVGIYPKKNLVEIVEITTHPFFVAVQFHPEFQSKPDCAHPLFRDFVKAAITIKK